FAIQTLLRSKAPISRVRGTWQQYQGIPLMPTYHPAYLLRNPNGKREVWADMKLVVTRMRETAL
ncbi:MAG: uracil-DNA glycosylase, partial [Desulfuromonas sp.]|nr:uracil-DNA glycosylase [Desulfuromonas sp.]